MAASLPSTCTANHPLRLGGLTLPGMIDEPVVQELSIRQTTAGPEAPAMSLAISINEGR